MKNGVPETYHEMVAMKKSISLSQYIEAVDPELVKSVFVFLLEHPENQIHISKTYMEWFDRTGKRVFTKPVTPVDNSFDLIVMTLDTMNIERPYDAKRDNDSSW